MKKILVVVAHPDDEVLGCGGTIAKLAKKNVEVKLLIIADGVSSRAESDGTKSLEKRKGSCLMSANILGISEVKFLDLPDNSLDSVPLLKIVNAIEDFSAEFLPEIIITHHSGDLNIDHQIVFQACITAFRPTPRGSVNMILSFETPSSTEWQAPLTANYFIPNWYVDISDTMEQKIQAFSFYSDEKREFPHPRSEKGLRALAAYRGTAISCNAAEAFVLIRNIER